MDRHFDTALAPDPGKNFDAVPAPAPSLFYTKPTFLKQANVNTRVRAILYRDFF
jgi:hypothetical protein